MSKKEARDPRLRNALLITALSKIGSTAAVALQRQGVQTFDEGGILGDALIEIKDIIDETFQENQEGYEEPTTMMAAIALSPGNKAMAIYQQTCVVVVQELGRHQFRWWTFDKEDAHVWENVRDREQFQEHLANFGLTHDAPVWHSVR